MELRVAILVHLMPRIIRSETAFIFEVRISRRQLRDRKTENKPSFLLCGVETHIRLHSLHEQRKKAAFRTQHVPAATSSRLTGHGS